MKITINILIFDKYDIILPVINYNMIIKYDIDIDLINIQI